MALFSMRRSRPSLFYCIALFLVVAMTTSAMAMASYVCPQLAAKADAMSMMDGMPCAGIDIEQPVHCAALSADTQASVDHQNAPPALALLSHAALLGIVAPQSKGAAWLPVAHEAPAPAGDPPYLRTQRIRV